MDDSHRALILLFGGGLVLLISWLPMLLKRVPLSLPIICLAMGYGTSFTSILRVTSVADLTTSHTAEALCEIVMLLALMGAGLRIDRVFGWRAWGTPWRLLLIAMPITMILVFAAAHWGLGMAAPAALLLAAALAPTDPVLAGDIQTGPPGEGEDGETRFGLTAEAGFNDGLAFPLILLALALHAGTANWGHWLGIEFAAEILIGIVVGAVLGWLMGRALFRLPHLRKISDSGDGLVAIGATFLSYAATVLLHGNGFIAVFVAGLAIRAVRPEDEFHAEMAAFANQVERVLIMLVLVLFGWTLGHGLLASLTWQGGLLAIALILLFRPIACWIAFIGSSAPRTAKRMMGIFGIRGIGTIYYILYATGRGDFAEREQLWAIAGTAILASIIVHGTVSTPLMTYADQLRKQHGRNWDHSEYENYPSA
ncbi:cation:proton antiporter [Sphingomonas sp. TX0543]|uniref:cation:proton antiporter n=1 Tax=unclassified Sphingomonas TaxID=196159 RepID=UPI0010F7984E|nr:cation:proton antiporter [Sphingomonas sp. 3P27F8]